MKVRTERPFYYCCTIWRVNIKCTREGIMNAEDEAEAIDRVYDMAKEVWLRQCTEVIIMDPHNGEVLARSTLGDHLNKVKNADNTDSEQSVLHLPGPNKEDEPKPKGFQPWDKPAVPREAEFYPATVGTYFHPAKFNKLT